MAVLRKNLSDLSPNLYDGVRKHMNIWQRCAYWVLSLFYQNYALTFCKNVGLKQILNSLENSAPEWVLNFGVSLGPCFAQNLYELLLGCHLLEPLFSATFLNKSIYEMNVQEEPLLIESIFHALYKKETIATYPLSLDLYSQKDTNISSVYDSYVEPITNADYHSVDNEFTNWFYLANLMDQEHVNFLRRFNPEFSFDDINPDNMFVWTSVSVKALKGYLEQFIDNVYRIDISQLDIKTLMVINQSQHEDFIIPEDVLQVAYRKIIQSLRLCQKNDNLLKILSLAYGNPVLKFKKEDEVLAFSQQYHLLMENRIQQLVLSVSEGEIEQEMVNILSEEGAAQIGIYTQKNSSICKRHNVGKFSYIYLVPLIKQFLVLHLNPWFKNFLSTLIVNVKFVKENDLKELELLYRKMGKFISKVHKMLQNLDQRSTIGARFMSLIQTDLVSGDQRMLKVFVESINKDVEEVVLEFMSMYKIFSYSVNALSEDLSNGTNNYVLNTGSVRNILGESDQKLYKLKRLFSSMKKVMDVINSSVEINNETKES